MVIGFLVRDRPSLLACSLTGSGFCPPSRAHLFAEIEVNSLQRFQGLLELSSASLTTFKHESFKSFSSVQVISIRDADAWVTPEILPSLLFLPLLAPFPNVKDFRICGLTLPPDYIGAEGWSVPLSVGPRVGIEAGRRFGVSRGISTNERFADPRDLSSPTASVEALSLGNCRAPSLEWFLRYVSYFPDLKSLSLIDFTWGSVGGVDFIHGPLCQPRQPTLQPPRGLSELALKIEDDRLVACAPRLLFESLSGSLKTLRLAHIDSFLSVGQFTALVLGTLLLTRNLPSQISRRVRFTSTHRTSPYRHSALSHTLLSHRSPYGSKPSNYGSRISCRRLRARATSRNLTSIYCSPPSRSKCSWMR